MKSNIFLVGFMASGKTTFGKQLAESFNYTFIDSDEEIEKKTGMSVSEIFKSKGEEYFRELESNFIQNFRLHNCVIATGGGMPCYKDNMTKLKKLGKVIFINASYGSIIERLKLGKDSRPLFKPTLGDEKDELYDLFLQRQEAYKCADNEVSGDNKPGFILKEIMGVLNR